MKFEDFKYDNDDVVKEMAELLSQLEESLDNNELSRSEFDELSEDVLQIREVEEYANDLEKKIRVQKAITVFREIIALIPLG